MDTFNILSQFSFFIQFANSQINTNINGDNSFKLVYAICCWFSVIVINILKKIADSMEIGIFSEYIHFILDIAGNTLAALSASLMGSIISSLSETDFVSGVFMYFIVGSMMFILKKAYIN